MRVICQIVCLNEYIISFHCIMFIWVHIDAWIIIARVLHDAVCCLLTELALLSFLPWLMCASYEVDVYMCFDLCYVFFTEVLTMFSFINVVTSTSMQTRHRDVADFSPCSAVILMPCKLDATERSMHILRYFSKGLLIYAISRFMPCLCFPW